MYRNIIRELKNIEHSGVNPKPEWVAKNRALLLSQIKNTVPAESLTKWTQKIWVAASTFLPRQMMYGVIRPVALLLVVVVAATTAYSGTVKASYDTVRGDFLYPVKTMTEKVQATAASLMGNKSNETKLHAEFAKRRAAETKKIVQRHNPDNAAKVSATVADLKNEMKTIDSKLEETKKTPSTEMQADVAKGVKQDTKQIEEVLKDVKKDLSANPTLGDEKLSKEITETKDLVKDVSVKAVEVMVVKHLDGDTSVSKEEIKQVINTSLQNTVNDVATSKQNIADVKTIVDTVKTEVTDLAASNKKQNVVAPNTKELTEKITTVANQTVAAVIKTEQATEQVDRKASEGRELVQNGELAKAVDKLKEANETTKEAEKISEKTIAQVQTVLPIVPAMKNTSGTATSNIVQEGPLTTPSVTLVTSTNILTPPTIVISTSSLVNPETVNK